MGRHQAGDPRRLPGARPPSRGPVDHGQRNRGNHGARLPFALRGFLREMAEPVCVWLCPKPGARGLDAQRPHDRLSDHHKDASKHLLQVIDKSWFKRVQGATSLFQLLAKGKRSTEVTAAPGEPAPVIKQGIRAVCAVPWLPPRSVRLPPAEPI